MDTNKAVALTEDDMQEMFETLIYPNNRMETIVINDECINLLHKWNQKGIDISVVELNLFVNLHSYDHPLKGENEQERRWRIFKDNFSKYYYPMKELDDNI